MAAPEEVTFSWLLLSAVVLMLLLGAGLVGFLVVYQKRLLRQQKHLRATEVAYQQQLLAATIEAQEHERERIGRDLHDGIGSTIATAKLLVHRLEQMAPVEHTELFAMVTDILSTAVQDTRRISHNLYPAVLTHFGLAEALRHLAKVSDEAGPLRVQLTLDYAGLLPVQQELALYRICQELVNNAMKHARGASLLTVSLQPQGSTLTLTVADDGCGFDRATLPSGGAGLRSIDARVRMLGARLLSQSAPQQGTRISIEIPTASASLPHAQH
ncbi:sensor histidine kinase [Hymenobacter sp. 15J16-1T3B]|uniref:sensor histidine kinase n=1 Tax=Hymenobacter sp. 15J16-1T3B TaxID=2886941 RepID=UPI001D10E3C5|nr:sensor histidine kinase [Hymenobacter sp. 15J16-1T3B]MCC3158254.1 sensor histidine kinase [Hymenobacter sp. 15J16-1T3B]